MRVRPELGEADRTVRVLEVIQMSHAHSTTLAKKEKWL